MAGPLQDVRVLDLTSGVGGPWCTHLLATYGADVIKIERPGTGDPMRRHGPFPDGIPHREKSALFLWLNTGKRSLTLDINARTGHAVAMRLAARCDVAIVDQSPRELARLRMTPEDLRDINPRLVVTSMTAFGLTGAYADWKSTNLTSYASGGQHYLTGDPDREPLQNGGYQAEYQAGTWAFGATLAALHNAQQTGSGRTAEVAGMEVMASILEIYFPDYAYRRSDALTTRRGNYASAVVGIYPALDGHIGIHAMPKNWPQLIDAMDAGWMATDERFADNRARLRNDDELSAQFFLWAGGVTKREAYERAGRSRAPITPVNTMADLLESQHLNERGFFRAVSHPDAGEMRYPGPPSHMPASPPDVRRAPRLGEHTAEVLTELAGVSPRQLVWLAAGGAV